MADIKTIPDNELKKDLDDSYKDVLDCTTALRVGVVDYSGGSVQEQLDKNKQFIKVIEAEIQRRNVNEKKS